MLIIILELNHRFYEEEGNQNKKLRFRLVIFKFMYLMPPFYQQKFPYILKINKSLFRNCILKKIK